MRTIKEALPEWIRLRERSAKRKCDKLAISEVQCFGKVMELVWRWTCEYYYRGSRGPGWIVVIPTGGKWTWGNKKGKTVIVKERTYYENVPEAVKFRLALDHVIKVIRGSGRDYISIKAPDFTKVSRLSVLRWEQFYDGWPPGKYARNLKYSDLRDKWEVRVA